VLACSAHAQNPPPAYVGEAAPDSSLAGVLKELASAPFDSTAPDPATIGVPSPVEPAPDGEPLPLVPTGPLVAPANLNDLDAWTDYRVRAHLFALPQEARLFYRRALMLHASGGKAEAIKLVRGVIKLDPSFLAPRLTLAAWLAFHETGEAIDQCGDFFRLARESFMLQIVAAANALYLVLQALFLSIVAIAVVVVALNQGRLRHGWMERLASFVTLETAGWWSWAVLIAPYLAGLGPALPSLVFLGLLWPTAKLRERSLFVVLALTLAGVPLMTATLDRLSSPLQNDRAPFHGVPQLQTEPYSPELRAEFDRRTATHPDSPFLSFAAGWMAQRAGDAAAAETQYRRTLELWPADDRALNNLGNTLVAQGRNDEAIAAYHKAIATNPRNAAAHFNIAQVYTMRFDFQTANQELARASAIDFELVKNLQADRAEAKWVILSDQWIRPGAFWQALKQVPWSTTAAGALPPLWRTRLECSGPTFSVLALGLAVGSLLLGWWFHRTIPVRNCGNCGRAICRRCAERRRELALCAECAAIWSRAESPEFGRVLLFQHRRRQQARASFAFRIVAVFVPGFGYLPHRKLLRPVVLMSATAALASVTLGIGTPFSFEPRFGVPGHDVPLIGLGLAWLCLYVLTVPFYLSFDKQARERAETPAAPVRRHRLTTPSNHPTIQAAA
jgi:tetratricopeptide (TPR) repeat protein